MTAGPFLSKDQILEVLSLSQNATAIYATQDIVIEAANDAMIAFWGKDRSVIGKPLEEAVPELKGQPFKKMLQDVLATGIANIGDAIKAELEVDGKLQTFYYDYHYRPIKNTAGQTYCILHTASDVTERELNRIALQKAKEIEQQQQQALKESEARFRSLLEQAPIAIAVLRTQDLIVELVNDRMLEIWGKTPGIKGMPLALAMPELTGQPFLEILKNVIVTGELYYAKESKAYVVRNGEVFEGYFDFICQPAKDADGTVTGVLNVVTEVTDQVFARKKIEESEFAHQALNEELAASNEEMAATNEELASTNEELLATNNQLEETQLQVRQTLNDLATSENRLSSMVASAPFPIGVYVGRELRILFANTSILDVWGKGYDVIGKCYPDILPELAGSGILEQLDSVYTTGIPYHARNQRVDIVIDGILKPFYFNYSFTPLYNAQGEVYGVMNTAAEITDLVITKQQVEQSEKNLANIILQAPVAMCILLGPEHTVEIANEAMIKLWGKAQTDVMKKPIFEALPDARDQGLEALMQNVYTTGVSFEANEMPVSLLRHGVMEDVYQNFVYQAYNDADGNIIGIIAISIDVTEQVTARKKIERAEEMLRMATDSAQLGTWHLDADSNQFKTSARFKEIFGFKADDVITYNQTFAQIQDDYQDIVTTAVQSSLKQQQPFNVEYPLISVNDGKQKWIRSVGNFVADADGGNYLTGIIIDITEQKRDEIRKNDFIGMVSHELKTPLTSLSAIVQVASHKLKKADDTFLTDAMDKANRQVKRMSNMINGFLNISRLESGKINIEKQNFDMDELLEEMINEMKLTVSTHQINLMHCDKVNIHADRDKISSVISNLLTNAVKYSPKGKLITVKCQLSADKVTVSVKDEGMGIKPQDIDKIFDRYYRVETNHTQHISGFGIGLYLTAEIVERHNGKIGVESESGAGSTFWFTLPI